MAINTGQDAAAAIKIALGGFGGAAKEAAIKRGENLAERYLGGENLVGVNRIEQGYARNALDRLGNQALVTFVLGETAGVGSTGLTTERCSRLQQEVIARTGKLAGELAVDGSPVNEMLRRGMETSGGAGKAAEYADRFLRSKGDVTMNDVPHVVQPLVREMVASAVELANPVTPIPIVENSNP